MMAIAVMSRPSAGMPSFTAELAKLCKGIDQH